MILSAERLSSFIPFAINPQASVDAPFDVASAKSLIINVFANINYITV